MNVVDELMRAIWNAETVANEDNHKVIKRVQEIKIHPSVFYDLMREPEISAYINHPSTDRTFSGIPLQQDPGVDRWKLVI